MNYLSENELFQQYINDKTLEYFIIEYVFARRKIPWSLVRYKKLIICSSVIGWYAVLVLFFFLLHSSLVVQNVSFTLAMFCDDVKKPRRFVSL